MNIYLVKTNDNGEAYVAAENFASAIECCKEDFKKHAFEDIESIKEIGELSAFYNGDEILFF